MSHFKELVEMRNLNEGLVHCLFLSEHLLPEGFEPCISIQYSGNLKKTHWLFCCYFSRRV